MDDFDPNDKVTIYVPDQKGNTPHNPIRLNVNGHAAEIPLDKETPVAAYFLPSLTDAGIKYRKVDDNGDQAEATNIVGTNDPGSSTRIPNAGEPGPGNSDSVRAMLAGGSATQASPVDGASPKSETDAEADAIINGNVDEVTPKLADLDDAMLARVQAAEKDREKPRNGVLNAIEAEQAKRAQEQQG
jgi:hypothetical protein